MRRTFVTDEDLDPRTRVVVRRSVAGSGTLTYAVTLLAYDDGLWHTIRLFDNAHGMNEMHRYTRTGGKQPAAVFHLGTAREAVEAAEEEVRQRWQAMVDGWRR
jgi:hypothetical protein